MSRRRHEEPAPLGSSARALIAAARDGGGPPDGTKERVRGALALALAGGAAATAGAGAAKALGAGSGASSGAALTGAVAGGALTAGGVGLGVKVALVVVALGAVGTALVQLSPTEDAARAALAHEATPRAVVDDPVPSEVEVPREGMSAPSAPEAIVAPVEEAPPASAVLVRPRVRPSPEEAAPAPASVTPSTESTLMEEMALLSPARAALTRGDGAAARELVSRYRARYPSGAFIEEFAAIEVEALCAAHDPSAPERLAHFGASYPDSTYAARLSRACD